MRSKAKGQLARLAMIIHCLEQSVSEDISDETNWDDTIQQCSVDEANLVLDFNIQDKIICSYEARS